MNPLLWMLAGACALFVVLLVFACLIEHDVREALLRLVAGPILVLIVAVVELGMKLPKFTRRRVTTDSLRSTLDDDGYEQRTTAINWPGGALVLLRAKRRER